MATNKESLIVRLRAACNGLPGAVIAWPHRILHEAAEELAAANARIAELEARCAWQPIATAPKMRKIVVTYTNERGKRRTVLACYYVDHALEMHDDYAEVGVWDEASGDSFAPAGWYEEIDHEGDIYALGGEPDYWQALPIPPKALTEGNDCAVTFERHSGN